VRKFKRLRGRLLSASSTVLKSRARGKYWRTSGFGSSRDGCELFDRARSDKKNIFVVEGASHYDLYDKPEYVDQAMKKLEAFYKENL
jgi:fermentation-respiration switch protein FrsA (DUF1100 family)